jgi:predicted RNA-binding protein with PIN domain
MAALPPEVASTLVRAIGAYIRATSAAELPPKLKRFKTLDRPRALAPHRGALLKVLDDDELTRARISEWMSEGRPPLSKDEREVLALAVQRPEGWEEDLAARAAAPADAPPPVSPEPTDARALAREKERAARAKEETRRARAEARDDVRAADARAGDLEKELDAVRAEATELRARLADAERRATTAERGAERTERKARAAADRAAAKEKAARDELRAVRRELRAARDGLAKAIATPRKSPSGPRRTPAPPERRRQRLRAPKGRLETDPETLDAWLDVAGVHLLVDGYNVTKAEGGFGAADLETQRRRLVEGAGKLARKKDATATIVFDGSDVGPGTGRRPRAPVVVEYSRAGESADDHLIARLESLSGPVVVATNDKELQHRAAALGATIATSNQLLALIR